MASTLAKSREAALSARSVRNRWYLTAPALVIIVLAAVGPLLIMVVYSFLSKGDYGGVIWRLLDRRLVRRAAGDATSSTTR